MGFYMVNRNLAHHLPSSAPAASCLSTLKALVRVHGGPESGFESLQQPRCKAFLEIQLFSSECNPILHSGHQHGPAAKALKRAGQAYSFQALIKTLTQCQAREIAWQGHSFQALVEIAAKCQALEGAWHAHSFQALIETSTQCQALKGAWQDHSFQALVKVAAKC